MNENILTGEPTAYITKKKSILKLYNTSNVYLNDGDKFGVELYNPRLSSVLAKIKIDGKYISGEGVVLETGQRAHLERFLDTNEKFVYNERGANNNPHNGSEIGLSRIVEIEFYSIYEFINHKINFHIKSDEDFSSNYFNVIRYEILPMSGKD
jgi:hypothetical protein